MSFDRIIPDTVSEVPTELSDSVVEIEHYVTFYTIKGIPLSSLSVTFILE